MTTSDLSWSKAKDTIVIGIGGILVALMAFVLKGQVELRQDFAVFVAEAKRDRADFEELKARVRALETGTPRIAQMNGGQ